MIRLNKNRLMKLSCWVGVLTAITPHQGRKLMEADRRDKQWSRAEHGVFGEPASAYMPAMTIDGHSPHSFLRPASKLRSGRSHRAFCTQTCHNRCKYLTLAILLQWSAVQVLYRKLCEERIFQRKNWTSLGYTEGEHPRGIYLFLPWCQPFTNAPSLDFWATRSGM